MTLLAIILTLLVIILTSLANNFDFISNNFDFISNNFDLISYNFDFISHNFDFISHNFDFINLPFIVNQKNFILRYLILSSFYFVLGDNCTCNVDLKTEDFGSENWAGKVFIYYGLTNFYQNHRRYVKSRSDAQLLGDLKYVLFFISYSLFR